MKNRTFLYTISLLVAAAVGFLLWRGFDDLGDGDEAGTNKVTSPGASDVKPDLTTEPLKAGPTATTSSNPPPDPPPPVTPSPTPGFGRRGGREGLGSTSATASIMDWPRAQENLPHCAAPDCPGRGGL